jgi:hypothetical protein
METLRKSVAAAGPDGEEAFGLARGGAGRARGSPERRRPDGPVQPRRLRRDVAVFAARIRFVAQPARKLVVRQYREHAILDLRDQFVGRDGDDGERPLPFACQRTDDRPLSFSYRHIPPMSEPFSKQSKATPRW